MAIFVFENMTATQAANFTSADTLLFSSATTTSSSVSVSNSGGLDLTTLTVGTTSLTFGGPALAGASQAGRVQFSDGSGSTLVVGQNAADTFTATTGTDVIYGFAGADSITANGGNDNIFGGSGGDTIVGGAGNEHLYGFGLTGDPTTDGADTITGAGGNDYIQGNAGADNLDGGSENDRINGGAGNDTIQGGSGNDTVNGNTGDDVIADSAGNDSLRGGQGNDSISAGVGNDVVLGDAGNDSLLGGAGIDVLTGGDGADIFQFTGVTDSTGYTTSGSLVYFTDTITDYVDGTDEIRLAGGAGTAAGDILYGSTGATFTSVADAAVYAQQLLDGHSGTTDIALVKVGGDTYLFYDASATVAGTIDSIIKLTGLTDTSVITATDLS